MKPALNLQDFQSTTLRMPLHFSQQFKCFLISRSKVYDPWVPLINIASAAIIFLGPSEFIWRRKHWGNRFNPDCLSQWDVFAGTHGCDINQQAEVRESHPDAAVTDSRRVCCALRVDVGLWIMNSTFHLQQRTVPIREGGERTNVYNSWVL